MTFFNLFSYYRKQRQNNCKKIIFFLLFLFWLIRGIYRNLVSYWVIGLQFIENPIIQYCLENWELNEFLLRFLLKLDFQELISVKWLGGNLAIIYASSHYFILAASFIFNSHQKIRSILEHSKKEQFELKP